MALFEIESDKIRVLNVAGAIALRGSFVWRFSSLFSYFAPISGRALVR